MLPHLACISAEPFNHFSASALERHCRPGPSPRSSQSAPFKRRTGRSLLCFRPSDEVPSTGPSLCPPLPHSSPCSFAVPSKSQAQLTTLGPLHLLLTTWYSVPRSSTLSLCFLISAQMPLLSIGLPGLFQVATLAHPSPFAPLFCASPLVFS